MDRVYKIADNDHLQEKLYLLKDIVKQHSFASADINRVVHREQSKSMKPEDEESIKGVAILPFCGSITN